MMLVYTKSAVFTTTSTFKTADNTILVMQVRVRIYQGKIQAKKDTRTSSIVKTNEMHSWTIFID